MALLYKFPKLYDIFDKICSECENSEEFFSTVVPQMLTLDRLSENSLILDFACGTGSLSFMIAEQRPDSNIIGLDISETMINQAQSIASEQQVSNTYFIQKDVMKLTPDDVSEFSASPGKAFADMIVCSFGYSAINDYRLIFDHTLSFLKKGGVYFIIDAFLSDSSLIGKSFNAFFYQWMLGSDQYRKCWMMLEDRLDDFEMQKVDTRLMGIPHILYAAKGVKMP